MKKILIFVSALTVALTGCAIKTHEVTSVPTNANVTIDIEYVKPANIKDALTNIHGYGRNTGKPKNIDKYTLSPKLYENTTTGNIIMGISARDNIGTDRIDGAEVIFNENAKGVFSSITVNDYKWERLDPLSDGYKIVNPKSFPGFADYEYTAKEAIYNLSSTYSMMDVKIKSDYSPEAVKSQLKRELKEYVFHGGIYPYVTVDNQRVPFDYHVQAYKSGSIIVGQVGVPVEVQGSSFVYGKRLDEVNSAINEILER